MQAHKELDASASDVAELEDKLAAAHRKLQRQEEERQEAESATAQQGLQLDALAQDMKALQLALDRVKQDRQQVSSSHYLHIDFCCFQIHLPSFRLSSCFIATVYVRSSVQVLVTTCITLGFCSRLCHMSVVIVFLLPLTFFLSSSCFLMLVLPLFVCLLITCSHSQSSSCLPPACQAALHTENGVFARHAHGHEGLDRPVVSQLLLATHALQHSPCQ